MTHVYTDLKSKQPPTQYTMKRTTILILGLLVTMAAIPVVAADTINITSNTTYEYNYTAANTTGNTTKAYNETQGFHCKPPRKQQFCDIQQQNESISLSPGEQLTTQYTGNITIAAACEPKNNTDTSVCRVNEDIEPGETYEKDTEACDIEVNADEADKDELCEPQGDLVEQNVDISVAKNDDGEITVTVQNQTQRLPSNTSTFNYEFSETLSCPETTLDNTAENNETLREIYANSYLRPTLETCQQYPERFQNKTEEVLNSVENTTKELQDTQQRLSQVKADKASLKSELNTTKASLERQLSQAETKRSSAESTNTTLAIALTIISVLFVTETLAVMWYTYTTI